MNSACKIFQSNMCFKKNATNSATNKKKALQSIDYQCLLKENRDPVGTRTQDPYIKSVLLYQLSYGIINKRTNPISNRSAKIPVLDKIPNPYPKKIPLPTGFFCAEA
jgi:hypothetical protein